MKPESRALPFTTALLAVMVAAVVLPPPTRARADGKESGGGDAYVADFVGAASDVARWLKLSGALSQQIDADQFFSSLDPKRIVSTDDKLTYRGAEVDAFYDAPADVIRINRSRWSSIRGKDLKQKLAAHEILRRMGLRDDKYEISRDIMKRARDLPSLQFGGGAAEKLFSLLAGSTDKGAVMDLRTRRFTSYTFGPIQCISDTEPATDQPQTTFDCQIIANSTPTPQKEK